MDEAPEEIPEFVRDTVQRTALGGDRRSVRSPTVILVTALLLAGAGLVISAVSTLRGEQKAVAVQRTVQALATTSRPTPVAIEARATVPTETPLPLSPTSPPSATLERTASDTPAQEATSPDTSTATATNTAGGPQPIATATASEAPPTGTPTQQIGGAHGVTGTLTLCNPGKPSYATNIEAICFIEEIINHTAAGISYGWLGVHYVNQDTGEAGDHMSWQGDLALAANCRGPAGTCGGAHRDEGLRLTQPGSYVLTMNMCFSGIDACRAAGGDWETLTPGVTITVVDWTPAP